VQEHNVLSIKVGVAIGSLVCLKPHCMVTLYIVYDDYIIKAL